MRSTESVTTAVVRKMAILILEEVKISSIVALLNMRKLVPINTPAIAAVGIWEKIGARNNVMRRRTMA